MRGNGSRRTLLKTFRADERPYQVDKEPKSGDGCESYVQNNLLTEDCREILIRKVSKQPGNASRFYKDGGLISLKVVFEVGTVISHL